MTPSSILALGETTENTWFDEIDEALDSYLHALQSLKEPGLDADSVAVRHHAVRWWMGELVKHGVTVCGGIEHA